MSTPNSVARRFLVVEGLTDATFFQELLRRVYLSNATLQPGARFGRENIPNIVRGHLPDGSPIEVEFVNQEGNTRIRESITNLLDGNIRHFIVTQDIDSQSPDQIVQSIRDIVYSRAGELPPPRVSAEREIEIEGGSVTVIPMGLYQDPLLSQLGVSRHAVEDYLINLILEDVDLRQECPELSLLLSEIIPTIQQYDGSFDSSKELFQLIKPIVQHGFSDTAVVRKVIQDANEDILRAVVAPILDDLESALGLNP
jgi:hypothetical protein